MTLVRSVSFRLLVLTLAMIAVLGLTVGVLRSVVQHETALDARETAQNQQRQHFDAVHRSLSSVRLLLSTVSSAALTRDAAAETRAQGALAEAQAQLDRQLDALAPVAPREIAAMRESMSGLPADLHVVVSELRAGRMPAAEQAAVAVRERIRVLEQKLADAEERGAGDYQALREHERAAAARGVRLAWISTVVTVLLSALLVLTVARSLLRPLRQVVAAVRKVSAGESGVVLPPRPPDEFTDIHVALQQFSDQAQRLRAIAYRDALTGLSNRARLEEALADGIIKCARNGQSMALMFMDLDNFKSVNESLGHSAGDRVLREAARRLGRLAPEGALVCRYSGDKFTIVLEGLKRDGTQQLHLRRLGETLLRGMAEPYQTGADFLFTTMSVGIAVYPMDGQTAEQIVSSADAAMYLAKRSGRNNVQFASPELTEDAKRKLTVVGEIRRGLVAGEFLPYYQPIVDVREGVVAGAEALIRWHHPQRGIVLPGEFIRVAEDSGLIGDLGDVCLTRAFDQALRWSDASSGIPISVNLSARQLHDRKLLATVEQLQSVRRLRPDLLQFEITESAMMERPDLSQLALQEIRGMGHKLGIDDFGTGYSSLGYLQRFQIDRIKIDRTFVERIGWSRQARAIVSATLALCKSLELEAVAEGVETRDQMDSLKELGCHLQQGYLFTPALPPEEFELWVRNRAAA
ncbi:MAG TPA: EAL domain-containing protein [Candidatus Binatia bacterium]|nr:EAL domain-containing protein [Candidatus Binatia bacterium]